MNINVRPNGLTQLTVQYQADDAPDIDLVVEYSVRKLVMRRTICGPAELDINATPYKARLIVAMDSGPAVVFPLSMADVSRVGYEFAERVEQQLANGLCESD